MIHLNSNIYTANLVHAKDVKRIEVTVSFRKRYVPYTIAVNGASNPTLSDLKFTGDSRKLQ